MFGFFKKKSKQDMEAFLKVAPFLVSTQITLSTYANHKERLIQDNFALGYMLGLQDAVLQPLQLEQNKKLAMIAIGFEEILGSHETGLDALQKALDAQSDPDVLKAITIGGNDYVQYLRSGVPPMKLFEYLSQKSN